MRRRTDPRRWVVCFSHLRWNFVYQRPQHLMSRFARTNPVLFVEEPVTGGEIATVKLDRCAASGVLIATPVLPRAQSELGAEMLPAMLGDLLGELAIERPVLWYYTPAMRPWSERIAASAIVYDCMDELANFRFASTALPALERKLMAAADVVFTGGHSLYEARRHQHSDIHSFPSAVDAEHFGRARRVLPEPADQASLPRPRLGFFGVIDERMDLDLLAALADARPHWSIVMVGPVVKIDPADLPVRANVHFLGAKTYEELPSYLSGWDVALMPFALNEATRFISPTKTPEYLAGGKPVVSTAIDDVVRQYGAIKGVRIATQPNDFIAECDIALSLACDVQRWRPEADALLSTISWDATFATMKRHVDAAVARRAASVPSADAVRKKAPLQRRCRYDWLVVGAGFAGSVLAERLASVAGKKVLVIDRRPHIGGNAHDYYDDAGILVHKYGPHIFHTNSGEIFAYLSRFTDWRPYEHRVLARIDDKLAPIPINRTTLNMVYGLSLSTDEEAAAFFEAHRQPVDIIRSSEDVVLSAVGRDLYQKFFQGYTRKQWGLDPAELDKAVAARIPTRTSTDDRYFSDQYQFMPKEGYTRLFERMLDHENIDVELGVDHRDLQETVAPRTVFTGPIDEYFGHRLGRLPYRSLEFSHETLEVERFQPVGVVNYPDAAVPFTRITEYKHLTGQTHPRTSISREFPRADGDPYYPIPRPQNYALFKRYEQLAAGEPGVVFVGRLASYRYFNMDQVVGQSLAAFRRLMQVPTPAAQTRRTSVKELQPIGRSS